MSTGKRVAGLVFLAVVVLGLALGGDAQAASAEPSRGSAPAAPDAPGAPAEPARAAAPVVPAVPADPPATGCVDVARRQVYLPDRLANDDELFDVAYYAPDYADEVNQADQNLKARYCRDGQGWKKESDNFPYDDPAVCVTIASPDGNVPREITPLEEINGWGIQNYDASQHGLNYCRDGNKWERQRGPNDPAEGCVRILRSRFRMPDTIRSPETPDDYGREDPVSYDQSYMVTYCDPEEDGTWTKTEDPFPYDQADLCVKIFYDPDEHGGASPPDQISPLNEIDRYGRLDGSGGATGTENLEEYCRDGQSWNRGARADDYPEGEWRDWADGDCITIVPIGDTPRRTDRHPEQLGQVLDDNPFDHNGVRLQYIDIRSLKTYCPNDGLWYRVDDYPLEEIVGDDAYRLDDPGQGTCVVIVSDAGIGLPESIVPPGHPADYGSFVSRDDYESHPDYSGQDLPKDHMYCFVNGTWQRGDLLDRGCAGGENPHIVTPEGLFPDKCWGAFPTSNYDIGYHGGAWDHFSRKLYGWWTDFFFGIGKGGANISLWSTDWAYGFDITKYSDLGLDIGNDYQVNLTDNAAFRLKELVFMVLVAWMAIMILRGKIAMAGGELAMSMILMALVGVLLLNRGDYMRDVWNVMDKSAKDILVAGQGHDPATYEGDVNQVIAEAQAQIHKVLVEDPYDYLNWGSRLQGDCASARNEILGLGPWGDADEPREMMRDAGCEKEASYNEVPNITRLLGAILTMVASIMVALLLTSVALTVVLAKFVTLAMFALVPFVALAVVLPAGGRRMAWLWATVLLQAVLAVMGTTLVLSMLVMALRRLMEATEDVGIIERFAVMVLLVLLAREGRKRLLASGQASAGRLADNMTNSFRLGGGGTPWQGPQGSQGVDYLAGDRGLNSTLRTSLGVGYGAAKAGAWVSGGLIGMGVAGYGRWKTARLGLRNLQTMQINQRLADGDPMPVWRGHWSARRAARAARRGQGGGGGGGGGGPTGGIAAGGPPRPRPTGGGGGGARPLHSGPVMPTARDRALEALNRQTPVPAQRYVNFREHRFWQGVHRAEQRYSKDVRMGLDPRFARDTFVSKMAHHTGRYERMTGQTAPTVGRPWDGQAATSVTAPVQRPLTPPVRGGGHRVPEGARPAETGLPGANRPPDPYVNRPGRDIGVRPEPRGPYERTADAAHRLGDRIGEGGRRMEGRWADEARRVDWRREAQPLPRDQQTWLHNNVVEPLRQAGNRAARPFQRAGDRLDRLDGAGDRWFRSDFRETMRRRQAMRESGELGDDD